jgi:hypothetical protein
VLPVLSREGIAPLGMKAFGDHSVLDYILAHNLMKPVEALQYCLNLPIAVQITGIDSPQILDQALTAARTFKPLSHAEVASLTERVRPGALQGIYERYKTTTLNDGTAKKPQYLG